MSFPEALEIAAHLSVPAERSPKLNVEALYRRYGPMVLRRCRRILKDEQLALDALQDTFVQVLRHADRFHEAAPGGLLYRIATNECLLRLRSRRRHPETFNAELIDAVAGTDDPASVAVARTVLARLLRDESASTRAMAVLHLVDGLTLDEVAAEVNLSRSGVRKRLRGLLGRVRALVEPAEERLLAA
jgi:RNA polymerase sigma-70 factor (ECF subfamily)